MDARLLKCWASMRFNDVMWLDPGSVLMSEAGLEATMSRSKTSNKLKKADAMKIFVSASSLRRGKDLADGGREGCAWCLRWFDVHVSFAERRPCVREGEAGPISRRFFCWLL